MFPYLIAGAIGFVVAKLFEEDEAPKYADGGSILLAPNGEPSNLTPEQYELVRTPAFINFFGDWINDPENASKVVDSNGEPLVVYHGTNEQFNVFSKKGKGNRVLGFFFTTDKEFSENYGESKLYFLNIKNIKNFNYEKFDSLNTRQNAENNYWQLEKKKLLSEMYNGVLIDRNDFFAGINFIRKDYVAFEPEQIKLADGTNTTFDAGNPDIRYAGGGDVKKVKFSIEEEEERTTISIKGIGEVILVETFPEYEFLEDVGEDGLEELGVEEGDMIGKIEHLEIDDEYKGKGYAKLLMNKAIEVAEEKGLMPLYLNASPMGSKRYGLNLEDLTGFYESFGFEVFLQQVNNNLMILK